MSMKVGLGKFGVYGRQLASSVVVGFVGVAVVALLYVVKALSYRIGPVSSPGPGLFPVISGTLVLVGAALVIGQETKASRARLAEGHAAGRNGEIESNSQGTQWSSTEWRRCSLCLGALVVFLVGVGELGFLVPAVVLDCAFAMVGSPRRVWLGAAVGILVPLATFAVFSQWLNVALPGTSILQLP